MSVQADLRFGRIAVTKSFLTEDVLTEVLIHQAADALSSNGIAKPLYQVAYDGGWLDEETVQSIRLAARLQEFLDGEKELADLVLKHGIAGKDIVEEILNQQRDLFKQTNGSPPGIATMLADEGSLDEKQVKALRTLEQRIRRGPDKPTVVKVVTGPASMPPLPPGMMPPPTPQPVGPKSTKSARPKCPGCGAPLPSIQALHCDACGALLCPKCRAVVKAEDVTCAACGNALRTEEPEPKSRKGLIAAIVVAVLLAGGGIALGPGGLYEKLVGPSVDYQKLMADAGARLDRAEEEIDKEQAEEAKAALDDADRRVRALEGHVPEDRVVALRTRIELAREGIAKLEKRLAERRAREEADRTRKEKLERSRALVAKSIKTGDPAEARRLLEEAIDLLAANAPAWHQLGVLLDREGKRPEAKKLLEAAAEKKQVGTLGLFLLGTWACDAKDAAGARKWLNAIYSVAPSLDGADSPELARHIADAQKEAHHRLVIIEIEEGNYAEAINHFRDYGDISGFDPELLLRIADLYLARDERSRAVDLYKAHLDRHADCKRRLLLEWRIRVLTGDDSLDKVDLVWVKDVARYPYFYSRDAEAQIFVKNFPDDAEEVGLPREACDVRLGEKNPMLTAFEMIEKRMKGLALEKVTERAGKIEEFINEAFKAGVPPSCVKRLCEAEVADLHTREPGNAKLADVDARVKRMVLRAPSVRPPPPEEVPGAGGPDVVNPPDQRPTASRTFDADKTWKDVFDAFRRAKEKFGDPSKATERQALEEEAIRSFQGALDDAKPAEDQPAKRWYEKGLVWMRAVATTFMGDATPKTDNPFDQEGNILSHTAAELVRRCTTFAALPSSPMTPQQAFESYLSELIAIRKNYPGIIRWYTGHGDDRQQTDEKNAGTAYLRRDAIDARTAQFESELRDAKGGEIDDTVKYKEKQLTAISLKLPVEAPLDRFSAGGADAVDIGEDVGNAARAALDLMIERVRK